ncbi:MAG: ATP-binding protein [Planctomycetota bacterium]
MNDTTTIWQFQESIPSDPNRGVEVILSLINRLEKNSWPSRDVFGVHMAMEEAVMNAIKHGNQRDPQKLVHIEIELTTNNMYAKVTDEGPGFDPEEVPDPTLDENLEKTSGRGLMLMRNYVDEVVYNDVGNSVELKKCRKLEQA